MFMQLKKIIKNKIKESRSYSLQSAQLSNLFQMFPLWPLKGDTCCLKVHHKPRALPRATQSYEVTNNEHEVVLV